MDGKALNLACGPRVYPNFINADKFNGPGVDLAFDAFKFPWPFKDNYFQFVYISHFLEHIPHKIDELDGEGFFYFINEVLRVIKMGGLLEIYSPSPRSKDSLVWAGHQRHIDINSFSAWIFDNIATNEGNNIRNNKRLRLISREKVGILKEPKNLRLLFIVLDLNYA